MEQSLEPEFNREEEKRKIKKLIWVNNVYTIIGAGSVILLYYFLKQEPPKFLTLYILVILAMLIFSNLAFIYRYKNIEKIWRKEIENQRKMQDPEYRRKTITWSIIITIVITAAIFIYVFKDF